MYKIRSAPRDGLYRLEDLLVGYDPKDARTIVKTASFRQYQAYYPLTLSGANDLKGLQKAVRHDAAITTALLAFILQTKKRPVGVMGGHSIGRNEAAYADVARLAREITRHDYLIVTGGGPGIMEAGHFGAYFAYATDAQFEDVLDDMRKSGPPGPPPLTRGKRMLNPNGSLSDAVTEEFLGQLNAWFLAAEKVKKSFKGMKGKKGTSVAIPSWAFGHELSQPFATRYAAFFLDSLRETALVHESRAGIVYARGSGGTVREIFEDAEENYYAATPDDVTPMIFFDSDGFWEGEGKPSGIKVDDAINSLFAWRFGDLSKASFPVNERVVFETDHAKILRILDAYNRSTRVKFRAMLKKGGKP
jgi:predicted Rossmann-fold nucleotide-binding protein